MFDIIKSEQFTTAQAIAAATIKRTWAVATSPAAIALYNKILITLLLILLYLGAAIYYTAQAIFTRILRPAAINIYRKARRNAPIAQAVLSRWIKAAYSKAINRCDREWQNLIVLAAHSWL